MKIIILVFLLFAQTPREIPQCKGAECQGGHDGQPAWCQNKDADGFKANCKCKRSCDKNDRGSDCATYCRTPKCKCDHGCPMTTEELHVE